jgi:rhodanese-related sulfurtransferase
MDELQFIKTLTTDQPFVPKYFGRDVAINKKGAPSFNESVNAVLKIGQDAGLEKNILIIDTRVKHEFRNGHVKGAINLQDGDKFETWLGSIISPDEQFYLIAANEAGLDTMIKKTAKIGYEQNIKAALLTPATATEKSDELDLTDFIRDTGKYTVIDVRNSNETEERLIFKSALTIPLPELRERINEVPTDKPIVVHCAAGYRSAAATSIINKQVINVPVYDLGDAVVELTVNS